MNSAFKFFSDLIHSINKLLESDFGMPEGQRLQIKIKFIKIKTQYLDQGVVEFE
jgi:hypothetical protein